MADLVDDLVADLVGADLVADLVREILVADLVADLVGEFWPTWWISKRADLVADNG